MNGLMMQQSLLISNLLPAMVNVTMAGKRWSRVASRETFTAALSKKWQRVHGKWQML
jgi:hypothetical protein